MRIFSGTSGLARRGAGGLLRACLVWALLLAAPVARADHAFDDLGKDRFRSDFRLNVGDWFIFGTPGRCAAQRSDWGRSLYLELDGSGWFVATDALFAWTGSATLDFSGAPLQVELEQKDAKTGFRPDAATLAALREDGQSINFLPGREAVMFSLHLSGEAMRMVALCLANDAKMPRPKPLPQSAFAPNCGDPSRLKPQYGAYTTVNFINRTGGPVQVYSVPQFGGLLTYRGMIVTQKVLESALGNIFLVTDLRGQCLGAPRVVGQARQQFEVK